MRSQNEVPHLGVGVVADGQQRAAHLDALLLVLGLAPRLEKLGEELGHCRSFQNHPWRCRASQGYYSSEGNVGTLP
jgi:hypothetical protein